MSTKLQHKRGPEVDLPQLAVSEIGFTTDTNKTFVGTTANGNKELANKEDVVAKTVYEQDLLLFDEKLAEAILAAEVARTATFEASESSRLNTFTINENVRIAAASGSETDRDEAYVLAEANRDSLYATAEGARNATASADHGTAVSDHSIAVADQENYDSLATNLQTAINDANANIAEFDVALESGVVATNIAAKLTELETTYSPELVSLGQQLEQKADGTVFRYTNQPANANVVEGSIYNRVEEGHGYQGNVISGGGISEGTANVIGGNPDAVGQAMTNYAITADNTDSNMNVITGGYDNVCNGLGNMLTGHHNYIRYPANHSVIAGGVYQKLDFGGYVGLLSGTNNNIKSTLKSPSSIVNSSVIAGGDSNIIDDSAQSNVNGGLGNSIKMGAANTIGGGISNEILGLTLDKTGNVIGGGYDNYLYEGVQSIIAGGGKNQSIGRFNSILGGYFNIVQCDFGSAFGNYAKTYLNGSRTFAGIEKFVESGDAQVVDIVKTITTTSGAQTSIIVSPRNNTSAMFTCDVVAKRKDVEGDSAGFIVKAMINKKADGSIAFVGSPVVEPFRGGGSATWSLNVIATNGVFVIYVVGEDGKTINWVTHMKWTENVS